MQVMGFLASSLSEGGQAGPEEDGSIGKGSNKHWVESLILAVCQT